MMKYHLKNGGGDTRESVLRDLLPPYGTISSLAVFHNLEKLERSIRDMWVFSLIQ